MSHKNTIQLQEQKESKCYVSDTELRKKARAPSVLPEDHGPPREKVPRMSRAGQCGQGALWGTDLFIYLVRALGRIPRVCAVDLAGVSPRGDPCPGNHLGAAGL